jgi:hypothetical protein
MELVLSARLKNLWLVVRKEQRPLDRPLLRVEAVVAESQHFAPLAGRHAIYDFLAGALVPGVAPVRQEVFAVRAIWAKGLYEYAGNVAVIRQ